MNNMNEWYMKRSPNGDCFLVDPNNNELFEIKGNQFKISSFIRMLNELNRGMAKTRDGVFIMPMYTDVWLSSSESPVYGPIKAYMDMFGIVLFFGPDERDKRPLKMYDDTEEVFSTKEAADKYKEKLTNERD